MPGRGEGPIPAKIMLVGEHYSYKDAETQTPLSGGTGMAFNNVLRDAGLSRAECYVTNLVNAYPTHGDIANWIVNKKKMPSGNFVPHAGLWVNPIVLEGLKDLNQIISIVKPNVIVTLGTWAMWALTGNIGAKKWRGSMLTSPQGIKVIPTYGADAISADFSLRFQAVRDLRRAAAERFTAEYSNKPNWNFRIAPGLQATLDILDSLLLQVEQGELWLDLDLETAGGHIACCGISWTDTDAICIPFMTKRNAKGYWSEEEETYIIYKLYKLLTHKNVKVNWQNGLYDSQYIYKEWHFLARGARDTMIAQHALFSDIPKSLAFQASLYADWYVYWKDEGKNIQQGGSEEEHWIYNCQDCVYTRAVGNAEASATENFAKKSWPAAERVQQFQQAMFWPVLKAMLKGIRVLPDRVRELEAEVTAQYEVREKFLQEVLGHSLNINSPKQMMTLFYEDLKQPVILKRGKKGAPSRPSCDDEALKKIGAREILLRPIVNSIADMRTLKLFRDNFILAKQDEDGRMRCSYNIGGSESGKSAPKTYRLSSSTSAFGSGTNLQTIPSEKSKSVGKASAREQFSVIGDPSKLPNLRSMYAPDTGFTIADCDLNRADLQVMAWDAGDELLKQALKQNVDLHLLNAFIVDGKEPPPMDELVETHPKYPDHRGPMKHKREFAKVFCHATDYLGKARTVAAATGKTVKETEKAQSIYLGTYKGIKRWQDRVCAEVRQKGYVENAFGYRWYIFDRIDDNLMPEAVAWIPQSTVSIVINKIWMAWFQNRVETEWSFDLDFLLSRMYATDFIDILLQVHDSLVVQYPTHRAEATEKRMLELSKIVIPYDDPLIIPVGINPDTESWGNC